MSTLDNLIAYWRMDEASGTRYDSVGSMDLTQDGSVGVGSDTGKLGTRCATLGTTPVGMYVAGTVPSDFSGNQLTLAGWYRLSSVWGYATNHRIAYIETTNGSTYHTLGSTYRTLSIKIEYGTQQIIAETYDEDSNHVHHNSSFGTLSVGTWYHIVATWNATTVTLYVNNVGESDSNHISMGEHLTINNVRFGRSSSDHSFSVDDWGVWDEIISSTDRSDLYNSGSGAIPPGLGTPAGTGNAAFFGFH